jgi:glycosyltransferase involved in cell wall biosynthesis
VAQGLEAVYPAPYRDLTSFETGNALDLAHKLERLLALPDSEREQLSQAARATARELWSWESVSERLLQHIK